MKSRDISFLYQRVDFSGTVREGDWASRASFLRYFPTCPLYRGGIAQTAPHIDENK